MSGSKIISARITSMPKSFFDLMPEVIATFENGVEKSLFSYYPDKIQFHPEELIGLTQE